MDKITVARRVDDAGNPTEYCIMLEKTLIARYEVSVRGNNFSITVSSSSDEKPFTSIGTMRDISRFDRDFLQPQVMGHAIREGQRLEAYVEKGSGFSITGISSSGNL